MARSPIPDPLRRRLDLERDLDPRRAMTLAEAYLSEGRTLEAVAFLHKADARERLEQLLDEAVKKGDLFLAREVSQALGAPLSRDRCRALAVAAAAQGKDRYAQEARRLAERLGE